MISGDTAALQKQIGLYILFTIKSALIIRLHRLHLLVNSILLVSGIQLENTDLSSVPLILRVGLACQLSH